MLISPPNCKCIEYENQKRIENRKQHSFIYILPLRTHAYIGHNECYEFSI